MGIALGECMGYVDCVSGCAELLLDYMLDCSTAVPNEFIEQKFC